MKYLDPKADLTFKRVFGQHPDSDKRMMVLWLRYLTEIDAKTTEVPSELLNDPQIGKALEEVKVSAFTEEELRAYDKFWDGVRVEKSLQHDSFQEGKAEGLAEGELKAKLATARNLMQMGLTVAQITQATGLTQKQIANLKD